jgi:fibronectin-binding autotransporter adhesin
MSGCNNTYTGVTTVSGNLSVDCLANGGVASGIGMSGAASSNLAFINGTLSYTGGNVETDRGFTLQGTNAINVTTLATTVEFSGQVVNGAAAGNLIKQGPGTLILSGINNTYTGGTLVRGGILRAGSTNAFGTGAMILDVAGATLDLDGFDTTVAVLDDSAGTAGNIILDDATLTISTGDNTASVSYAGAISGTGALVKNGAQAQRLTGCGSSYTGSTTINGGVIEATCLANGGSNSSIGASTADAGNLRPQRRPPALHRRRRQHEPPVHAGHRRRQRA